MSLASIETNVDRHLPAFQEAFAPLGLSKQAALLDFPDHSNVGDSAIWLGERAFFADAGVSIKYVSTMRSYNADDLRAALPEGDIFLHGGGNFGSVWPDHQKHRLAVLRDFPDRNVIQLPQSIHFDNMSDAEETKQVVGRHGRFTAMVRDTPSYEWTDANLSCRTVECPDMALYLRRLDRMAPRTDIVRLLRTDREQVVGQVGTKRESIDWLVEPQWPLRFQRLKAVATNVFFGENARRIALYDALARQRVNRGARLLSQGRVVITDRLHGHIMCLLLGIPHVALDNSYGKVGRFMERWTKGDGVVRQTSSLDQAEELARELLPR